ncbi:MAG: aldo/keto reductase [Chloroflexi bacterium]|nr:aldo/keto reductase [Chloroflexota bacterium]
MNYRTLGRTLLPISEVSLGGAYLMGSDPDQYAENTRQVVQCAAELGINYIDTAPLYGQSEILLGEALAQVTGKFYIATKVGYDPVDFDYRCDSVLRSLERSLQRLRIDKLTVAQIHEVNVAGWERIMEPGGTLEGLRAAQEQGLCDFIGITGRAIPLLARLAATGEFDTVLVYHDYHPGTQLAAEEVLPAAAAQNMGVVIGTPLAGGLFADAARRATALANLEDMAMRQRVEQWLHQVEALPGTVPQQAYRTILADARVSTISSGAATVAELAEVAQASGMGPLVL